MAYTINCKHVVGVQDYTFKNRNYHFYWRIQILLLLLLLLLALGRVFELLSASEWAVC